MIDFCPGQSGLFQHHHFRQKASVGIAEAEEQPDILIMYLVPEELLLAAVLTQNRFLHIYES